MTWSHPRGIDPLVACSAAWQERTGVAIQWDARSLQDFESFPVRDLAARYDLLVIDHPHVGQITAEQCLLPLDDPARTSQAKAIADGSVGPSARSYRWRGHVWALPIDAAAQVQAWRPDLLPRPLQSWGAVMGLAGRGRVLCPLRPPHALMAFFTLAGNLGTPCRVDGPLLIEPAAGERAYQLLQDLAAAIDPACFDQDPIDVLERMAEPGDRFACAPLLYGYVSYAHDGFRPKRIAFADLAATSGYGVSGSALGGTGIAVSARTAHPAQAIDFAYWVASGPVQTGLYAAAGGQPGHRTAWKDARVDQAAYGFYGQTLATLDGAWLRPRFDGYMAFQAAASDHLTASLRKAAAAGPVVAELNRLFARAQR